MFSTNRRKAPRILLVDNESERRQAVQEDLVREGFRVSVEGDAQAALDTLTAELPSVVLIDGGVPNDGAVNLCRALRRRPDGPRLSVLVMLAREQLADLQSVLAAGASDVVEKPCHPSLLAHRVRASLDARAERRNALMARGGDPDALESGDAKADDAARLSSRFADAVARAKNSDQNVAVLFVDIETSEGCEPPDPEEIALELRRATSQYEGEGVISHSLGRLQVACIDETGFALLIPELGRLQDAAKLGNEVHACIRKPFHLSADLSDFRVHIGIATYPADGFEPSELLDRARGAAVEARREGSTNLQFFNGAMNRWAFERLTLEQNLRQALERDELTVYYQPKMEILTRRIIGVEALVRWNHPSLGMISPGQFIPLAEETGLIVPIGEWVLAEASRQNVLWQEAGFEPIRMAVNLSPAQFRRPDLFEVVKRILDEQGMSPEWLELELTEGMLMHDAQTTIQILRKLKQAGIHLSIDDFGTGYSSLSYLKRFPIDALKIDQSFVRDVTTNPEDAAIATSIILMGHSLKLNVIAEGVETDSQLSFLKILQCNEIQGYLISPPVPPDKAEAFLTLRSRV